MIRKLTKKDQQTIVDFCLKREKENLFVLGSFRLVRDAFKMNRYYGYFVNNKLEGLAVYFGRFGSFVINALDEKIINELVDFAMKEKIKVKYIPVFKKYAKVMIKRLEGKYKIKPKNISEEIVFILQKENFINFAEGGKKKINKKDLNQVVMIDRILNKIDINNKITAEERKRIIPEHTFVLWKKGRIVSKANLHGLADNYFQIGGVATLPEYQRKGYAKRVMSKLCGFYFKKGLKYGLLFTSKDNLPARKVYKALGFMPIDEFIIAEY